MAKEAEAVVQPSVWRDLFRVGLYKRSQGRIARQVTYAAIVVAVVLGAWSLHAYLVSRPSGVRYGVSFAVLVAGLWLGFRLVNLPKFADFLIAVEAEMNKVSWPGRTELVRSVIVVLVTLFGMTFVLYMFDVIWQVLLSALGVLG